MSIARFSNLHLQIILSVVVYRDSFRLLYPTLQPSMYMYIASILMIWLLIILILNILKLSTDIIALALMALSIIVMSLCSNRKVTLSVQHIGHYIYKSTCYIALPSLIVEKGLLILSMRTHGK